MLFASDTGGLAPLIALIILGVGFMRMGKLFAGNKAVKGAVKDGMFSVLGRIFKK